MSYRITYTPAAVKQLEKLDKAVARKIIQYMKARADNPTKTGKALRLGLKGYWRHRVGDYRVISSIENDTLTVLVVRIGHRKEVYE
jgi:mRNA interferase RelE/StbE